MEVIWSDGRLSFRKEGVFLYKNGTNYFVRFKDIKWIISTTGRIKISHKDELNIHFYDPVDQKMVYSEIEKAWENFYD